jgi:hypothetical protein
MLTYQDRQRLERFLGWGIRQPARRAYGAAHLPKGKDGVGEDRGIAYDEIRWPLFRTRAPATKFAVAKRAYRFRVAGQFLQT